VPPSLSRIVHMMKDDNIDHEIVRNPPLHPDRPKIINVAAFHAVLSVLRNASCLPRPPQVTDRVVRKCRCLIQPAATAGPLYPPRAEPIEQAAQARSQASVEQTRDDQRNQIV
jgi:hypothetical protein